jgi:PleD family two-component response regulator
VLGGAPGAIEPFAIELANLERVSEGPQRLVDRILPYVRLHAFSQRLKRMLKSLDAKGMIDPDTGLLAHDAFWRDLNRAVGDAEKRGVGLSIARFSFDGNDRRLGLDAARLVARLMRDVDFACREADNSIFAVFTETDLRAAHVVARRIASVLKNTMLLADRKRSGLEADVTLATLKPTDTIDSLIARVVGEKARGG